MTIPEAGKIEVIFTPGAQNGSKSKRVKIDELDGPGVFLAMTNTDKSITEFAHQCFRVAI